MSRYFFGRFGIATRIAVICILVVAIAVTASVALSLRSTEQAMRGRAQAGLDVSIAIAWEVLHAKGTVARIEDGKLRFDDYTVNGNNDVVDRVTKIVGGVATIFMGDTRVATNVAQPDGSRAVGTKLAPGAAYDAIFKDHKPFRGEADILGVSYFTVYEPILDHSGAVVGILFTGVKQGDFLAVLDNILIENAGAGLLIVLLGGIVVLQTVRRTLRPVAALRRTMLELAEGKLDAAIAGTDRADEIGLMAQAVAVFKENAVTNRKLEATRQEQTQRQAERAERVAGYISAFEASVGAVLPRLAASAGEMRSTAGSMSATADETKGQATTVAAAAEQASANVQTVASATEELSGSVREIGRQVGQSTEIAGQAVGEAKRTDTIVQGLSHAAQKIGDVVELISDIASRTNLLALNATIEAARAGDAGKGFAVVASEVKSLADQTAKATGEISEQVAAMQGATQEAVQAIAGIGATIVTINEIATTIASAVEEQGAATQEIARNVQQAAEVTGQVSSNIIGVNHAAAETGTAAGQVLAAADDLGSQAENLRRDIDHFLTEIRAA